MGERRIVCRRTYVTRPVAGFSASERVRVVRRDADLLGYFVVRLLDRSGSVAMHESHIGAEVAS